MFLIDTAPDPLQAGDRVICINDRDIFNGSELRQGKIYTIKKINETGSIRLKEIDGGYFPTRFKKCSQ